MKLLETIIHKSISEVDEKKWDEVLKQNNHICSHSFLKAVEESPINDCDYNYPVIYDGDMIVALTCVYSISTDLAVFAQGFISKLINGIRKIFPNFLMIKMVECGSPVALGNMIFISKDCEEPNQALHLIANAVEEISIQKNLKMMLIRDYYEEDRDFYDQLKDRGYHVVPNMPDTFLPIRWKSFDDYVKDMRSRYKRRVKRNYRKLKDRNIECEIVDSFSEYADLFARQYKNIFDNAKEYAREILPAEFYANIDKYKSDRIRMMLYREDGEIIAHCMLLLEENVLRAMYVGKENDRAIDVYPIILYDQVKQAIENNLSVLKIGITSYVAKTDMGADIVPMYMYLKVRKALFPGFIPWAFTKMTKLPKIDKHVFNSAV